MPHTDFPRIVADPSGGMTILECPGLTWKSTSAFRSAVGGLPRSGGIVFDLRGERSDSAGTAAIICAVLDITAAGQPVVLLAGAGLEMEVLMATGLGEFARIVSSLDEAEAALCPEASA